MTNRNFQDVKIYKTRADQIIPGMLMLFSDGTARLVISMTQKVNSNNQYVLGVGFVKAGGKFNIMICMETHALFRTIVNEIKSYPDDTYGTTNKLVYEKT